MDDPSFQTQQDSSKSIVCRGTTERWTLERLITPISHAVFNEALFQSQNGPHWQLRKAVEDHETVIWLVFW